MPGSVESPLAGRTYPMEGTAVMLPLSAPYTDPVTLLVCGGSNFGTAVDNCVSIQPEVENPTWTLERMVSCGIASRSPDSELMLRINQPSKRVMTCIAGSFPHSPSLTRRLITFNQLSPMAPS